MTCYYPKIVVTTQEAYDYVKALLHDTGKDDYSNLHLLDVEDNRNDSI